MTIKAEIMTLVVRLQSAESWQQQYFEEQIRRKVDELVAAVATLEAENRALLEAGKVLALRFTRVRDPETWEEALELHRQCETACDIFTGQPGAIGRRLGKGVE